MIGARLNRLSENTVINKVTTETYSIQAQRDRSPTQTPQYAKKFVNNISLSNIQSSSSRQFSQMKVSSSKSPQAATSSHLNSNISSHHYPVDSIHQENKPQSIIALNLSFKQFKNELICF